MQRPKVAKVLRIRYAMASTDTGRSPYRTTEGPVLTGYRATESPVLTRYRATRMQAQLTDSVLRLLLGWRTRLYCLSRPYPQGTLSATRLLRPAR